VLAELESLHVEMARFAGGLRGTVRILCNTVAMSETLPPRLGHFLMRHADIDVELQEMPSDAVLDALRRGVGDLGIVADHVDTTGFIARPWLEDRLVAVLPQRMLRGARSVRYVELLQLPFVGLTADSGLARFLSQQASRNGRLPHHRVRVRTFDAAAQLVAAGVGVAVMPLSPALRWRGPGLRIVALKDAWACRSLLLCATVEAAARPAVRALVEALAETGNRK
jgi:DNA-binding transcriptional LysR family regulator